MQKTKWLFPMMLAGIVLAGSTGVYAGTKLEKIEAFKNHGVSLELNGQSYTPMNADGQPLAPITYGGVTYLPIRSIGETLNTPVLYDAVNNRILIGQAGGTTNASSSKDAATTTAPATTEATSIPAASAVNVDTSKDAAKPPAAAATDTPDPQAQSPVYTPTPGPIDTLTETPPTVYNVAMTTGVIQSPYLSADFPFPADAERVSLVEQLAGGKKQLSLVYRTQADLNMVGNAYVAYYTGYNMEFGAKKVASSGMSIVGIVNDAFGVSIQGNPMSLRPGYNSVSIILAQQ